MFLWTWHVIKVEINLCFTYFTKIPQTLAFCSFYVVFEFYEIIISRKVIHAFISPCLNHCDSLYTCLGNHNLTRPKLWENTAARKLLQIESQSHLIYLLCTWLQLQFRVDFKILQFMFNALAGLAPSYIAELSSPYMPIVAAWDHQEGHS